MKSSTAAYKKQLSSKEISFYHLFKNNSDFDFVLFPEEVKESTGYFPLLESGNLLGKDKSYWFLAVEAIAKFHHFIKYQSVPFIEIDSSRYSRALENTLNYAAEQNVELPSKQMRMLTESLSFIKSRFQPIHDDFLPQNVMVEDNQVKIIDWEDMQYGFAEHDVGRFLGDLNSDNPSWNKKYYPLGWRDSLVDAYVQNRLQLDPKYDIQIGQQLVHLGEMWNYLGPIEMCLKRKETKTEWFLENLKALQNA